MTFESVKKLASAVEGQISQTYDHGEIERLQSQVESLQKTAGVLAALICGNVRVSIKELEDLLPSYGYPSIVKDFTGDSKDEQT